MEGVYRPTPCSSSFSFILFIYLLNLDYICFDFADLYGIGL